MSIGDSVFKAICQDVLAPCGVKVGGYREELFEDLTEKEKEELYCQIW